MAAFIAGEGNWLPMAMTAAAIAAAFLYIRSTPPSSRARILATMNVFVGVMLAVMGVMMSRAWTMSSTSR